MIFLREKCCIYLLMYLKMIRLGYSKKMLEEIKKYYNGKILNKGELC